MSVAPAISLEHAQAVLQRGDRRLAHDLCLKLVEAEPTNEQAWLLLAETAETAEEAVSGLGQALRHLPDSARARQALHLALQALLKQDAYLAYRGETARSYRLSTAGGFEFLHPKDRAALDPFPPPAPSPAGRAFAWLAWSLLGLIPAGLGTLVCAPVAMWLALRLMRGTRSPADRARAVLAAGGAAGLWLLAVLLALLLLAHL